MSCDHQRRAWIAHLAQHPTIAAHYGGAAGAARALEAHYDAAANRREPTPHAQQIADLAAKARWPAAQREARAIGIDLYPHPARSPGPKLLRGYQALLTHVTELRTPTMRCRVCGEFTAANRPHPCPYPAPVERTVPVPAGSMAAQVGPVLDALERAGGTCYFVGGVGRDLLLGVDSKDADLEVHGLTAEQVLAVAQQFGTAIIPKNGFPVVKLKAVLGGEPVELDLALPRTEEPTVQGGRQGFTVYADPHLGLHRASERRDVTIGAIAGRYDPATQTMTLIDCHGGMTDLEARVLRAVSAKSFADDPTRVLRMMQLAGRFGMTVEPETARMAQVARAHYEAGKVSTSEQWAEWSKLALKASQPSMSLQALQDTGWLAAYPHLAALPGVPPDRFFHPEGDAWLHTKLVADQAARIAARDGLGAHDRLVLVLAAICHDLAKPATTNVNWQRAEPTPDGNPPPQGYGPPWEPDPDAPGAWRRERVSSHGHEEAGEPMAEAFLRQIGAPEAVIAEVKPLVRLHLRHIPLVRLQREIAAADAAGQDTTAQQRSLARMVRRLAVEVAPSSFAQLARLIEADMSGRAPLPSQNPCAPLVALAAQLGAASGAPVPLLKGHGKQLIAEGLTRPGPAMGVLLQRAYEAQLDGAFADLDGAMAWVRAALLASPMTRED